MTNRLPAIIPPLRRKAHVTEDEARLIWTTAKKPHVYMLIKLLWHTGLRISEALKLTPNSLIVFAGDYTLLIETEKRRKTKKHQPVAKDKLPIPADFGEELRRYSQQYKDNDRLFPAHRSTYFRQIQKCAKDAGIDNWQLIHPHSFRHGFVYHKASQGVHPYILSKLARHDDIRTTLGYYEPSENDLRQAMNK